MKTRLERKNRTDIVFKGSGGLTDAFDDAFKYLWRINDEEFDYISETLTDEEIQLIVSDFETISDIKIALNIINNCLNYKNEQSL